MFSRQSGEQSSLFPSMLLVWVDEISGKKGKKENFVTGWMPEIGQIVKVSSDSSKLSRLPNCSRKRTDNQSIHRNNKTYLIENNRILQKWLKIRFVRWLPFEMVLHDFRLIVFTSYCEKSEKENVRRRKYSRSHFLALFQYTFPILFQYSIRSKQSPRVSSDQWQFN